MSCHAAKCKILRSEQWEQNPGFFRVYIYIGDEKLPNYMMGIIKKTMIRIPINQPGFNGMSTGFFRWLR